MKNFKQFFRGFAAVLMGMMLYGQAFAIDAIHTNFFGSAIDGYDPVAYFTDKKPVKGSNSISHEWNGAKWYFSSAENKEKFIAEPEKFAPQYGGYCAWAVSQGYSAPTDATAWKVVDGKLYLNYNKDVQATWSKDIPGHIKSADKNWPTVKES